MDAAKVEEQELILTPGIWLGRGSWRVTTESIGLRFQALISIQNADGNFDVRVEVESETGVKQTIEAWIVPDESGLYSVNVTSQNLDVSGIAKMESLPHLGLLFSEDGSKTLTIAIFELPEVFGSRGFLKIGEETLTFEVALHNRRQALVDDDKSNVVSFTPRPRT